MRIGEHSMQGIVEMIETVVKPGTVIPKPQARGDFVAKHWGCRRGERALIYTIPNHRDEKQLYEKGITESEWVKAYDRLTETGQITRKWFCAALGKCNADGSCNFTTIGGVFELLGVARYAQRGVYVKA